MKDDRHARVASALGPDWEAKVRGMTDRDLKAFPGIGPKLIQFIREDAGQATVLVHVTKTDLTRFKALCKTFGALLEEEA